VGPDFFATMGIPLVAGREFTRDDDESAPPVAVVNQTMAARFWREASPVGKRLKVKDRWLQVVGVARDVKYANMFETKKAFFYVPLLQNSSTFASLMIRTRLSPAALNPALLREVRALDPGLVPSPALTMREQVDGMASAQKIGVTLLAVLGGLALLLASIGLYAVMSYSVSQGKRELGLRMALGASASSLLRFVLSRGLTIAAGGVLLGAAVAFGLARFVGRLLFAVRPGDPATFGFALATMAVVSLAACYFPARRATRTDPARALRD